MCLFACEFSFFTFSIVYESTVDSQKIVCRVKFANLEKIDFCAF